MSISKQTTNVRRTCPNDRAEVQKRIETRNHKNLIFSMPCECCEILMLETGSACLLPFLIEICMPTSIKCLKATAPKWMAEYESFIGRTPLHPVAISGIQFTVASKSYHIISSPPGTVPQHMFECLTLKKSINRHQQMQSLPTPPLSRVLHNVTNRSFPTLWGFGK